VTGAERPYTIFESRRQGDEGGSDEAGSEKKSQRDRNVDSSEAKGIPKDRLGPSGLPKIHAPRFPTRKAAKDAAQQEGKGKPSHHSPPDARDHFHPTDSAGRKIPGKHFEH
jgi:hypothetical protein